MPHQILRECEEEFKKLESGQDDIKAQLFDIKDNHLKHIEKDIVELKVAGANCDGKLTLLIWALPLAFAVIGAVIVLIGKIWE